MSYRLIESCSGSLPASALCDHLGVSRSGYHEWLRRQPGMRAQEDDELGKVIEAEFKKHRQAYGSRLGRRSGRRQIARPMRERGLIARKTRRFVATTAADPKRQTAPNVLNREFHADGPNRKWLSDITIIPTDEGELYLATTMCQ